MSYDEEYDSYWCSTPGCLGKKESYKDSYCEKCKSKKSKHCCEEE